jgi:hypothetical protein
VKKYILRESKIIKHLKRKQQFTCVLNIY